MFKSLQAFRGLAALSVVAYHLSANFGDQRYFGHAFMTWLTWRMNLGTDFFFVLSGFIIMLAHQKDIGKPDRLLRYVERRFTRLYPSYWIYAGSFTLLVLLGFGTAARPPNGVFEWITTFSLVRFVDMLTPIPPAWTLFHEVCFYAAFALMIVHRRIGVTFFLAWQAVCLLLLQYPGPPDGRTPFLTYLSAYNIDFSIGMVAYLLFKKQTARSSVLWMIAGVVLFGSTITCEANGLRYSGYSLLYAAAFGAVILSCTGWESSGRTLPLTFLPKLGDASLSIYLVHEAVLSVLLKLVLRLPHDAHSYQLSIYAAVSLTTILVGYFAYLFVERPAITLTRKAFRDPMSFGWRWNKPEAARLLIVGPSSAAQTASAQLAFGQEPHAPAMGDVGARGVTQSKACGHEQAHCHKGR